MRSTSFAPPRLSGKKNKNQITKNKKSKNDEVLTGGNPATSCQPTVFSSQPTSGQPLLKGARVQTWQSKYLLQRQIPKGCNNNSPGCEPGEKMQKKNAVQTVCCHGMLMFHALQRQAAISPQYPVDSQQPKSI
jgi:hypothetical protein